MDSENCYTFTNSQKININFIIQNYTSDTFHPNYNIFELYSEKNVEFSNIDFNNLSPPPNTCFALSLAFILDIFPAHETLLNIQAIHNEKLVDLSSLENTYTFYLNLKLSVPQDELLSLLFNNKNSCLKGFIIGGETKMNSDMHCFGVKIR